MLVTKKLVAASLKILYNKYGAQIQINQLLKNLKLRYETDLKLFDAQDEAASLSEVAGGSFKSYLNIINDVFNEQRSLLHRLNKKAEVDEDVIKKYLRLIDIEEEKLSLKAGNEYDDI